MQCTIEIFERGQWKPCCLVETDAPEAGPASPSILSYFPSYIKEGTLPVSLHYSIRSEPYRLVHWPSFLLDLIPDGEGREYLLYEHHLPDNKALDWQLMLLGAINPLGDPENPGSVRSIPSASCRQSSHMDRTWLYDPGNSGTTRGFCRISGRTRHAFRRNDQYSRQDAQISDDTGKRWPLVCRRGLAG